MATDLNKLIRNLKNGDEDAFGEIYSAVKDRVFYTVLSIIKDYQLAEDIMQDTFIKVRNNVKSFKEETNPTAWIVTIARNNALNEWKRRKKEMPVDLEEKEYLFNSYTIDNNDTPVLRIMMKILDETEREIVTLKTSGFKHSEIAKITGKPLGTVLWIYNKSLKKLKSALEKEEG